MTATAQCLRCGNVGRHTCLRPEASAVTATADPSHPIPAGCGTDPAPTSPPGAGSPTSELAELIAEVLAEHQYVTTTLHAEPLPICTCNRILAVVSAQEWRLHVAPLIAERLEKATPPVGLIVTCPDMEQRAELFNDGYQEAMRHQTGGAEHRAWLVQVAEQAIARWVETGYRVALAGVGSDDEAARKMADQLRHLHLAEPWLPAVKIADAVLSEIDFADASEADPNS